MGLSCCSFLAIRLDGRKKYGGVCNGGCNVEFLRWQFIYFLNEKNMTKPKLKNKLRIFFLSGLSVDRQLMNDEVLEVDYAGSRIVG